MIFVNDFERDSMSKRNVFLKGFFISIMFLLLFYLPVNYYYSTLNTHYSVDIPDFSWSGYAVFYPSVIHEPNYTLLYEEIKDTNYDEWTNLTGLRLRPTVTADGCFMYSYDSFDKNRLLIKSNSEIRLVLDRGGNLTEYTGTEIDVPLQVKDKIYFYAKKDCVPYIAIYDSTNTYLIRLKES